MNINNISHDKNINFGMLKKSQLKNQFQRHFTEKFKCPLEKFDTFEELERWSAAKFLNMKDSSKNEGIGIRDMLKGWENGLNALTYKIKDSSLWQVIAYDGIKKIKDYIPLYEEDIMLATIDKIYSKLNPHHNAFNFVNEYSNILKEKTLTKMFPKDSDRTGWLKFVKSKDPEENKEVINDIRRASIGTNWCTKSNLFAKLCITDGNFYIYYKKLLHFSNMFCYGIFLIDFKYHYKSIMNIG